MNIDIENKKNNGKFYYGNNIAEKWPEKIVLKELNKLISFLQNDEIIDSNILSISLLLTFSKSNIKTEKQFEYIKNKFELNDTVSGSFNIIKDLIKNRWILNGAKNKINSNITKLVLSSNYDFNNNENNEKKTDINFFKPVSFNIEEETKRAERLIERYRKNRERESKMLEDEVKIKLNNK